MGRGGTNERLAVGVLTGTCHSNFLLEEELTKGSACLPRTRIGPEAIQWFGIQHTKKSELQNAAQEQTIQRPAKI